MDESDKRLLWIGAYLISLHRMLPFPEGIDNAEESRIPGDAKLIADRALEHFDQKFNQVEGR